MSININIKCSDCHAMLSDGDDCYCSACNERLAEDIRTAYAQVKALTEQNEELTRLLDEAGRAK